MWQERPHFDFWEKSSHKGIPFPKWVCYPLPWSSLFDQSSGEAVGRKIILQADQTCRIILLDYWVKLTFAGEEDIAWFAAMTCRRFLRRLSLSTADFPAWIQEKPKNKIPSGCAKQEKCFPRDFRMLCQWVSCERITKVLSLTRGARVATFPKIFAKIVFVGLWSARGCQREFQSSWQDKQTKTSEVACVVRMQVQTRGLAWIRRS